MKKINIFILAFLFSPALLFSQQMPINDQYIFNNYFLSPTYAGIDGNTKLFLGYRNERINFPGSTLLNTFSLDVPVAKNMAFGASLLSDQSDVFKNMFASLSYTYRVKITDDQSLSFALWGGIYENTLDFSHKNNYEIIVDDPVVYKNMNLRGTGINSGTGILYQLYDFNLGIDVPYLIESKLNYKTADNESPYQLHRTYQTHASYPFQIKNDWEIKAIVIGRYTMNTPLNWEAATTIKYKKKYWFAVNLRKSMETGFSLGGKINESIVLNYTYEYSNKALGVYNSGTHEVGIGYYFGKRKIGKYTPSENEKKLQREIDSMQNYLSKLEKFVNELQKDTDKEESVDIKQLKNELEQLKSEMNNMLVEVANIRENVDSNDVDNIDSTANGERVYYVVLDSYKKLENAVRGAEIWKERNFKALVISKDATSWYHIYENKYTDLGEALDKMNEIRKKGYPKVWVLIYK
ncbi:MAG: PorP/SprF family type IX secretion system membrane protein [Bacteroidota bacterium]|nr:PorP/SprF family type IX secretion system membrane protein [Bacteroidota bacterium]